MRRETMATKPLNLPIVDLSSADRTSTAQLIRQACLDHGFFYLMNHGIEEDVFKQVFDQSRRFFSLSLPEKMKLARNASYRGYSLLYDEKLDTSLQSKGDLKELFDIGPPEEQPMQVSSNQWPAEEVLPAWRSTMESYQLKVHAVGEKLVSLIALALNLNSDFFQSVGAYPAMAFVRLLHYPGENEIAVSDTESYGASAHSDYGMVTLLATEGVPGLQICREKDKTPQHWEDVPHINGTFVVNLGDMLERWTNCLFRSTLHRVMTFGQERFSIACFFDPNSDCMVECLESFCSETSPPRFPPIRTGDYLEERFRLAFSQKG